MEKPNFKVVKKMLEIEEKIKLLYEQRKKLRMKLIEKYGVTEFVYDAPENKDGHKFVRMSIKDNLELFQTGEPIFKSTSFERFDVEIKFLKNEPKVKGA